MVILDDNPEPNDIASYSLILTTFITCEANQQFFGDLHRFLGQIFPDFTIIVSYVNVTI